MLGQGLVQMAGGGQGKGGPAGEGSTRRGQTPVSQVGQCQQLLCPCQREGGKLWVGGNWVEMGFQQLVYLFSTSSLSSQAWSSRCLGLQL